MTLYNGRISILSFVKGANIRLLIFSIRFTTTQHYTACITRLHSPLVCIPSGMAIMISIEAGIDQVFLSVEVVYYLGRVQRRVLSMRRFLSGDSLLKSWWFYNIQLFLCLTEACLFAPLSSSTHVRRRQNHYRPASQSQTQSLNTDVMMRFVL